VSGYNGTGIAVGSQNGQSGNGIQKTVAIVIPTAYSTYGDSTTTEGGPLCKYVLAQFRSDADLSWVINARNALTVEELKWKVIRARRPHLKNSTDLWSEIVAGVGQAMIVVIDPEPLGRRVRERFLADGAYEGRDFNNDDIIKGCASALIAGTPVAYLPNELARVLGWYPPALHLSFAQFTPEGIQRKIGSGLRDAKVFAARAHATFDPPTSQQGATTDVFRSPATPLVVAELLSTGRVFDVEHAESAALLNEVSDAIADSLASVLPVSGIIAGKPLVAEYDSKAFDHLQAADIAAGWARELLELGDERALARAFKRVLLNGHPIPEESKNLRID
jgi:hypothetical protein